MRRQCSTATPGLMPPLGTELWSVSSMSHPCQAWSVPILRLFLWQSIHTLAGLQLPEVASWPAALCVRFLLCFSTCCIALGYICVAQSCMPSPVVEQLSCLICTVLVRQQLVAQSKQWCIVKVSPWCQRC